MTDPLGLFVIFLRAALLSVGGMAALPQLRQDLVSTGILSEHQVLEALVVGRITPGPTGLYIMVLGYFAAGPLGALVALSAGVIPPLSVVATAGVLRRQLLSAWAAGIVRGVVMALSGLLISTALGLLAPDRALFDVPLWQLAIAAGSAMLTLRGGVHPGLMLLVGAVAGVALGR